MKTRLLKVFIGFIFLIQLVASCKQNNDEAKMDAFITKLMDEMTVEEKLGQMNLITPYQKTGPFANLNAKDKMKKGIAGNALAIAGSMDNILTHRSFSDSSRLKIPILLAMDIIHGYRTVFPMPLGLSCTWDTMLIEKTARIAAIESTSMGYKWTFSPMVDLSRDPRWGRVFEGSGEDPYLGGLIARAMVKGYQGDDLSNETSLMSCVKHFALYGASEAGRDYNTVDMSRLTMYQDYFPPCKAAIDAGAGSVMTAFNVIDGVPCTANRWLLTDLLRKQWGFEGFVVTDMNAMQELVPHGVVANSQHAAELALKAGVDMDMGSECMVGYLQKSLEEGNVTIEEIDKACRRVLETKYKLGLFNESYKSFDKTRASKVILTDEHKQIAKEAALKSMVLLKNNGVLPLKKDSRIALIGPFADNQGEMLSAWASSGDVSSVVTIHEGIKKKAKSVVFAKGTQLTDDPISLKRLHRVYDEAEQQELVKEALQIAQNSDVIVAILGEGKNMSGESRSRTDISIPNCQRELLKALKETGKPVVLLLANGRPLTIESDIKYADAILETWRLGTMAGDAVAEVLFGDYNPSGKLTMTFPRSVGQIPIYYNHKNTGRPFEDGNRITNFMSNYFDQLNSPLFPFGYGLSYTTFEYSKISLSDTLLVGVEKVLKARLTIINSGKYAGEETVQLYMNDPVASVARPVKELKKFQKVYLQPGESKELSFAVTPEDLKFYNSQLKFDWEPGDFFVYIGTNSQEVKKAKFYWKKD